MKRITSLLLVLAVILTMSVAVRPALAAEVWDGTAAADYAGGTGTWDDPYLISTPGQLALFRDQVNEGKSEICAQLSNNVDMGNRDWEPIGLNSEGYNGLFEGNGYAIRNLKISRFSRSGVGDGSHGGGLFGVVSENGTVRHVNVDGVVTVTTGTEPVMADIGAICGANRGVIEECFSTCSFRDFDLEVYGEVGTVNVGGIVGINNGGTIRNCYVVGAMDVEVAGDAGRFSVAAGGLVGTDVGGTIQNCYSVMTIRISCTETCIIGGLIGFITVRPGTYENLYTNQSLCPTLIGKENVAFRPQDCEARSESDMKSLDMLDKLGSAFAVDSQKVNDGYPILAVMRYEEEADANDWYTEEVKRYGLTQAEVDKLIPVSLWNKDLTKNVTRVEFAEIAVNLYESLSGQRVEIAIDNPFTDISNEEIVRAYQLGITNGTSATTFAPYNSISRQDMATMLTRVYKKLYISGWSLEGDGNYKLDYTMPDRFQDDGKIAGYARDSVYYMASQGIIKGSGGYFYPVAAADGDAVGNATREQAIITSMRYYSVNR